MRFAPRRLLLCCGITPAVVTAVLSVVRPTPLMDLDSAVYDVMARTVPVRPPSGRVLIVDVDEHSLAAVGQWPWPRDRMAELIDGVQALGAAVVASDVVFAEPERGADAADPDAALVRTARSPRVVLGYALRFDPGAPAVACGDRTIDVAVVQRNDDDEAPSPLFRATGAVCNLRVLNEASRASGFLNAAPDSDGILRRVPLLIDLHGRPSPSLALAAVSRALRSDTAVLREVNAHTGLLRLAGHPAAAGASRRDIPVDGRANLLLRYRGPKRTFRHVSALDILSHTARAADFEGRVVFIGTTALGTREVVATPLDTLFSGVEVQATVADNVLQQDALYRPEHGRAVETALLLLLASATALAVGGWGALWGIAAAVGMVAATWALAIALLSSTGMMLSPLYPTLAVAGSVSVMTGARLRVERQRAAQAGRDKATSQSLMVETLLTLTETRDVETGQHSRRIQHYTRLLAEQLAQHPDFCDYLTSDRIALISRLAVLHDIGKVGIADAVLNKPGPLTPAEFSEMQRHPTYGRDVIAKAERVVGVTGDPTLELAKDIVYTHHERWDGSGYPDGLSATSIPIAGRVIAVVDVYDALVAHRPYRKAMSHDQAEALIVAGSGSHFDTRVVEAFLIVSPAFRVLSELALEQANAAPAPQQRAAS